MGKYICYLIFGFCLHNVQGDHQVIDVMKYIMSETGRKGGGKKLMKDFHVAEKLDVDVDNIGDEIQGVDNRAPILYMFFKKGNFDVAEVSADNCIIHLCAGSVINAILGYIMVYYVFYVGYSPEHESFMYFIQYAFLGEKKLQRVSVGVNKLVHKFDTAMVEVKKSKGYKKLCV